MCSTMLLLSLLLSVAQTPSTDKAPPGTAKAQTEQRALHDAVRDLTNGDYAVVEDAQERLMSMPRMDVIGALAKVMNDDPAFREPSARYGAYGVLLRLGAAQTEVGFELLLKDLERPDVTKVVPLLRASPPEKYDRLAAALAPILNEEERTPNELYHVMELLAKTRSSAQLSLPDILRLWRAGRVPPADDTAIEPQVDDVKMGAAEAMLQVGGIDWALANFGIDDAAKHSVVDMIPLLEAMAKVGGETKNVWFDAASREQIRDFTSRALKHPVAQVRTKALWAFLHTFPDDDVVVDDAEGNDQISPALMNALREILMTDRDADMRASARRLIDGMPRELRKHRERAARQQAPSP